MIIPINLPLTPIELLLSLRWQQPSIPWSSYFCTKGFYLYRFFGWQKYGFLLFHTPAKHLLRNRLLHHAQKFLRKRPRVITTMKQSSTTLLLRARAMDQLQVLHTQKFKSTRIILFCALCPGVVDWHNCGIVLGALECGVGLVCTV